VVNAEKCFSTLANFITSKIPQSRLATLLGDRLLEPHVYELTTREGLLSHSKSQVEIGLKFHLTFYFSPIFPPHYFSTLLPILYAPFFSLFFLCLPSNFSPPFAFHPPDSLPRGRHSWFG